MTPDGIGTVTEIAVIREKVKVRMRQPDDTYDVREYGLDQVCKPGETLPEPEDVDVDEAELNMEGEFGAFHEEPAKPAQPKKSAPRPPKPPRPQQGGKEKDKETENPKEEQKRRYPRPKGKKQSTEQFIEKNMSGHGEEKKTAKQEKNAPSEKTDA